MFDVAQRDMIRRWLGAGLAALLMLTAGVALAAPRLERDRCVFRPPRGERVEIPQKERFRRYVLR